MNWKRVLLWAVLAFAAVNVVGFASGIVMGLRWEIYGATMEAAVANARIARRIGYAIVIALAYWRFALGVARWRFAHVVAMFVVVQILDAALTIGVFRDAYAPDLWGLARGFAAALTGYALATWQARRRATPATTSA